MMTVTRWLWLLRHPFQWFGGSAYRRAHGLASWNPTLAAALRDRKTG
jgi:hypothetical protein